MCIANLSDVDWDLLDRQKQVLERFANDDIVCAWDAEMLNGIVRFIESVQNQAAQQLPVEVVFPNLRDVA
jgi:hypothetical protein